LKYVYIDANDLSSFSSIDKRVTHFSRSDHKFLFSSAVGAGFGTRTLFVGSDEEEDERKEGAVGKGGGGGRVGGVGWDEKWSMIIKEDIERMERSEKKKG
jgi:hypothetical protein